MLLFPSFQFQEHDLGGVRQVSESYLDTLQHFDSLELTRQLRFFFVENFCLDGKKKTHLNSLLPLLAFFFIWIFKR